MTPAILIYDGDCPVCLRARDWIAANAQPGAITSLPCQDPERIRLAPGIKTEACMQAMHLVLGDTVFVGAEAFPHIFSRLNRYHWVGCLFHIPGSRIIAPFLYAIIAKNRLAISALFIKKGEADSCNVDKGCE